jgi:hypothetical protein
MIHQAPGHVPLECTAEKFGSCAICNLIATNEHYRRLFAPPGDNEPAVPAPQPSVIHAGAGPVAQVPQTTVPLAGDLFAALTKRIGVDRAVKYVSDKLGVDCHCEERRRKANELDARVRRFLGW